MSVYPRENQTAVQFAHRGLLQADVILARWFPLARYADAHTLRTDIQDFLERHKPRGSRRRPDWKVLDVQGVDRRVTAAGDLAALLAHARACRAYGLPAVRAYRSVFHAWPAVTDMRRLFVRHLPQALARVENYLRRRKELPVAHRRRPRLTPDGRAWLTRKAHEILGRAYRVHIDPVGDAWLFRLADPGRPPRGRP